MIVTLLASLFDQVYCGRKDVLERMKDLCDWILLFKKRETKKNIQLGIFRSFDDRIKRRSKTRNQN